MSLKEEQELQEMKQSDKASKSPEHKNDLNSGYVFCLQESGLHCSLYMFAWKHKHANIIWTSMCAHSQSVSLFYSFTFLKTSLKNLVFGWIIEKVEVVCYWSCLVIGPNWWKHWPQQSVISDCIIWYNKQLERVGLYWVTFSIYSSYTHTYRLDI